MRVRARLGVCVCVGVPSSAHFQLLTMAHMWKVHFKAFVRLRLFAKKKRSNASCSKCFGYICAFPVFAFESRTRGTSVHLFCSQMLVSLRINFPIAGTLPPSVSSISAPCTFERTCDSDGSGRLSILIRPAVGRR